MPGGYGHQIPIASISLDRVGRLAQKVTAKPKGKMRVNWYLYIVVKMKSLVFLALSEKLSFPGPE